MKVIGITGGIGSGKSLVTAILEKQYQAHILNTDQIAKQQMDIGGKSYEGVIDFFGSQILREDATIDRSALAKIVFDDKDKLRKLNDLTHPAVREAVQQEINQWEKRGIVPYLVIETALMIEAEFDLHCNEVWYVYSSETNRRKRLKEDRNYTDEKINSIFASQCKDEEFRKKFSKVIDNNGDRKWIEKQVKLLIEE